jgi:hypothetical protein
MKIPVSAFPSLGGPLLEFMVWGLGFAKATRGGVFQSERVYDTRGETCRPVQNRNRRDQNRPPVLDRSG